jgi:rhodanese-related sulfurtransferase
LLADVREAHMNFGSRFEEIPELDVTGTYEKWEAGEVSLVDVREPDEWELGHIDGIAWIPLGHLPYR